MKKDAPWFASISFALAAVALHLTALAKATNRDQFFDKAMKLDVPEKQRQIFMEEAHQFYHAANCLRYFGIAMAILGSVCLFILWQRNGSCLRWITVLVLAFYLLLQFAVV